MTIAHDAHPSEDHDDTVEAHYASLEREPEACLCYDGWHFPPSVSAGPAHEGRAGIPLKIPALCRR
jgi:hypothetical protein